MKFYIKEEEYKRISKENNVLKLYYLFQTKEYSVEPFENCFELNLDIKLLSILNTTEQITMNTKLNLKLIELDISNRLKNTLKTNNLIYMKDVIHKTEGELLNYNGFGRKQLVELKDIVKNQGFCLGMKKYS